MARRSSSRNNRRQRSGSAPRGERRRSRSRGGGKRKAAGRSRDRSAPAKRSRSRSARRRPSRSQSRSQQRGKRRQSRSPQRGQGAQSRSRSRCAAAERLRQRRRNRSRSLARVPPTEFSDYEPSADGGGWYVYKKTGKWKFHPETGLYLHVKSEVYYAPRDGTEPKEFRKIDDDDDPIVKKMKQSEEMRKAIQNTEFVTFDQSSNAAVREESEGAPEKSAPQPAGPEPPPTPVEEEVDPDGKREGRVQKWDYDKGFGFIVEIGKGGEDKKMSYFVHRKHIVGSTPSSHINLKENARVQFKPDTQDDGRPCALEVVMIGADGKPLQIHIDAQNLEKKRKSYYVTAESLGVRVHAESWPGLKKSLQDRFVSDEPMEELGVYFSVFDGHGGTQIADHAAKTLHKNIMAHFRTKQVQPASRDEKIRAAIKEAFLQTDKEILAQSERKSQELMGTTAVTALLHGNPKLGTPLRLVIANLGDSRAVLCRAGQAVAVSDDHKPTRTDEKKRVERAGGLVLQIRGTWRMATAANPNSKSKSARKEYQGLAMTRCFGDLHFKQPIMIASAEPEVQVLPITQKDLFIVLATDGIFDVLSNREVVDLALKHWSDPEEASKTIVRTAYKKGSEDNLTALVIQFGWADTEAEKYSKKAAGAASSHGGDVAAAAAAPAVDDGMDMFG